MGKDGGVDNGTGAWGWIMGQRQGGWGGGWIMGRRHGGVEVDNVTETLSKRRINDCDMGDGGG